MAEQVYALTPDDEDNAERKYQSYDTLANRSALGVIGVAILIIIICAWRAGLGPLKGTPWLPGPS